MSRGFVHRSAKLALVAACLAVASGAAAQTNVVVMESLVSDVRNGQELTDDRQLNIPSGKHVIILVNQDGKLKQIRIDGPRAGSIRQLLNPEPIPTGLLKAILQMARTGGADETTAAASRNVPMTLNDVDVLRNAQICLEDGSLPTISPAPGSASTSAHITDNLGAQSAALDLSAQAAWPANVPIRDGGRYRIIPNNGPQVEVRFRVVPTGSLSDQSSVQSLGALVARDCKQQLNAALKKIRQQ